MKRTIHLLLMTLLLCAPAFPQGTPPWEIFAGYSFQRADVREYFKSTSVFPPSGIPVSVYSLRHHYENLSGWDLSVTENMNRWFGGTLDLSGYYKSPQFRGVTTREQKLSILYGPRFSYRRSSRTLFAHLLFGGTHTSATVGPPGPSATDFSFTVAAGGGFDLTLTDKAAVRVLEADYLRDNNALGTGQNSYRLSAGLVFHLGKLR